MAMAPRISPGVEDSRAKARPGCHHLKCRTCRHLRRLNVVLNEVQRNSYLYWGMKFGRNLPFSRKVKKLSQTVTQSMHHHVFRRCSHSSANISSFCSTDCSSSVNPPVFLSPSANGNCLTNPTSLFTSLQPPHTLFTWKVWNTHQCFLNIQYIDLPTLRSLQCQIKGAQGSNVF